MNAVDNRLLILRLRRAVQGTADDTSEQLWLDASEVFATHDWVDEGIRNALQARDREVLGRRLAEWESGAQPYPAPDRVILKRALKAFRKRMKLQQLDEESGIGGGPFSSGHKSSLVAIQPPPQYPAEVWDELALQGRLRESLKGFFELVED